MKKAKRTLRVKAKHSPFWPFGISLFVLLLLLDQYTKYAIRSSLLPGMSVRILPGIWFTSVRNTGTAWGLFQDTNMLFVWLSVIAFGLLIFFFDAFTTLVEKITYTLLLAGLWGNLLDRIILGHVVDFIDLRWWPVFNLADSCITVAILLYALEQWRKSRAVR